MHVKRHPLRKADRRAALATLVRRFDSTIPLIYAKNAPPLAFTIDRITRSPITASLVAVTRNIIGLTFAARCKMYPASVTANDELIFTDRTYFARDRIA